MVPEDKISYIKCLDFSNYKEKSMKPIEDGGYLWDANTVELADNRYRKWLYLCLRFGADNVEIEVLQDLFWHLHILDTNRYAKDCDVLFGHYLHHNPYPKEELKKNYPIKWDAILQV
jgi:hypothetical protein